MSRMKLSLLLVLLIPGCSPLAPSPGPYVGSVKWTENLHPLDDQSVMASVTKVGQTVTTVLVMRGSDLPAIECSDQCRVTVTTSNVVCGALHGTEGSVIFRNDSLIVQETVETYFCGTWRISGTLTRSNY